MCLAFCAGRVTAASPMTTTPPTTDVTPLSTLTDRGEERHQRRWRPGPDGSARHHGHLRRRLRAGRPPRRPARLPRHPHRTAARPATLRQDGHHLRDRHLPHPQQQNRRRMGPTRPARTPPTSRRSSPATGYRALTGSIASHATTPAPTTLGRADVRSADVRCANDGDRSRRTPLTTGAAPRVSRWRSVSESVPKPAGRAGTSNPHVTRGTVDRFACKRALEGQ
jgi:hypothetical protein